MFLKFTPNPLKIEVSLSEPEKEILRLKLYIEFFTEYMDSGSSLEQAQNLAQAEVEEKFEAFINNLKISHHGDCVKQPTSCGKCNAERWLGFSSLDYIKESGLSPHTLLRRTDNELEELKEELSCYNPLVGTSVYIPFTFNLKDKLNEL